MDGGNGSANNVLGKRERAKEAFKKLAWPLKEARVNKLLEEISQHKASISLALASEARYVRDAPKYVFIID